MAGREVQEVRGTAGQLLSQWETISGRPEGTARTWSEAGVLTCEATFCRGEYDCSYQSWWDNGVRKEQGTYSAGRRVGIYKWFDTDGRLMQEVIYDAAP
jgi:antitoxin component YwqK of YwqJK toxin-antitoxin module